MLIRWLSSKTVRHARTMYKHVHRILCAQRDILTAPAIEAVETSLAEMNKALADGANDHALKDQMEGLESVASKWLKPYPNSAIRENIEVLLVALSVAMAIRTFFLQPFKIPTASMQPTLFGVTPGTSPPTHNLRELQMPGAISRLFDYWINGNSYFNEVAPSTGRLEAVSPPVRLVLFNISQTYVFDGKEHTIWFPPDELFERVGYRVSPFSHRVDNSPVIKSGDPILRLKITAGDHLFVDRLTYNFRPPKRGEIIVFETRGTGIQDQGQFYIKRLVALGGEKIQIGADRHLIINGKRLDKDHPDYSPHFENVYSFDPNEPPRESHYSGHVGPAYSINASSLAPIFTDAPGGVVTIRSNHYMVMGDNTLNSSDSRFWGDFSRTNVIGRYFFVYWPFSERFGMGVK